jgi:hypothetical protein
MPREVLADGSYFIRTGTADLGGGGVAVTATGARTMVGTIYFADGHAPFEQAALLAALKDAGFAVRLLRCPAAGARQDSASWYRLTLAGKWPAVLGIDPGCRGGDRCAGVALRLGGDLPVLSPADARVVSDDCGGSRAAVTPPGAPTDEEKIAGTIAALLPPAARPGSAIAWADLGKVSVVAWKESMPRQVDASAWLDANPRLLEGSIRLPTRRMTVFATGHAAGATDIYLRDDSFFSHTDVFAALRRQGYAIALAACGKPYIRMREDWFRIDGRERAPAVLYRSRTCESGMCSENYAVLRAGRLPSKPGLRQPGTAGCRE